MGEGASYETCLPSRAIQLHDKLREKPVALVTMQIQRQTRMA